MTKAEINARFASLLGISCADLGTGRWRNDQLAALLRQTPTDLYRVASPGERPVPDLWPTDLVPDGQ